MDNFDSIITQINPYVYSFLRKKCNKFGLDFNDLQSQYYLIAFQEYNKLKNNSVNINKKVFYEVIIKRLNRYINKLLQYKFQHSSFNGLNYINSNIDIDYFSYIELKIDLQNLLSELEYKIILLKYEHNYTEQEIANILNLSRSSIARYLNKAKEKIKNYLFDWHDFC